MHVFEVNREYYLIFEMSNKIDTENLISVFP